MPLDARVDACSYSNQIKAFLIVKEPVKVAGVGVNSLLNLLQDCLAVLNHEVEDLLVVLNCQELRCVEQKVLPNIALFAHG